MNHTSTSIEGIESDLFIRLCDRDPRALDHLMRSYFPVLCSYAEQFVADSALAQDIVQEAFISYWQHAGKFESFGKIKAFLYTITRNGAISQLRKRRRDRNKLSGAIPVLSTAVPAADSTIVQSEYLAKINLAVQQLPVKMQEVFRLSFEEGLSVDEISRQLGITPKTVRNQKYKSLVLLRKRFGHLGIPLLVLLCQGSK